MFASFTQTYGSNRILELNMLQYDIVGNYFRNLCDKIVFVFHNCPAHFIERGTDLLTKIYSKDKLVILQYSGCGYLESFRQTLAYLKQEKVEYLLQIQDDHHGFNSRENIENLSLINGVFDFVRTHKVDLLQVFKHHSCKKWNKLIPLEERTEGGIEFYKYDVREWKKIPIYCWNDGTYFGQIDYLISLFSRGMAQDVWNVEMSLNELFSNTLFTRWGTNKYFFDVSNIHGRNITRELTPVQNLQRFFGELPNWSDIEKEIQDLA